MSHFKAIYKSQIRRLLTIGSAFLLLAVVPKTLHAQQAAEDALSMFPADTQQFAYTNLADLRDIPQYPMIRDHLLSPEIRSLEDFLRPAGIDAEQDVNEIVLGWRGGVKDTTRFFGIAEGQFDTDKVHQYFINNRLPYQQVDGYDLYAFGSGAVRSDLFFTFINSSTAAFGGLDDLKAVLNVVSRNQSSLATNSDFTDWENQLEGSGPQWGIATGQAAANEAIPWLTQGRKINVNLDALFGPVKAVLYSANWSDSVTANLTVICKNSQAAEGLAQLFNLLRNANPSAQATGSASVSQILQNLQVQTDGSKLELTATSSIQDLTNLLNNPSASTSH